MDTGKRISFLNKITASPMLLAFFTLILLFAVFAKNCYIPPAIAGFLWGVQNKTIIGFKNFIKFFLVYFVPLMIFATVISFISFLLSGYYSEFTNGIKNIVLLSNLYCILIFFAANIIAFLIFRFFSKNKYLNIIPKSFEYLINNPLKLLLIIFLCVGAVFLIKDAYQTNTMLKGDFELIQDTKHPNTLAVFPYKDDKAVRFSYNKKFVNFELIDATAGKIWTDRSLDLGSVGSDLYAAFIDKDKILLLSGGKDAYDAKSKQGSSPGYLEAGIFDLSNYGFTKIDEKFDFGFNRGLTLAPAGKGKAVLAAGKDIYRFETKYGLYKSFDKIAELQEKYTQPAIFYLGDDKFAIIGTSTMDDYTASFINVELLDLTKKTSKIIYKKDVTKMRNPMWRNNFEVFQNNGKYFILADNDTGNNNFTRYLIILNEKFEELETRELKLGKVFYVRNVMQLKNGDLLIFNGWLKSDEDPRRVYIYNVKTQKFNPIKNKPLTKRSHIKTLLLDNGNVLIFNNGFSKEGNKIELFKPAKY